MKRESEVKDLLISNAIHTIAEGGFEKATTKEMTYCGGTLPNIKMNEVYIYRLFGSKENLYESAFARLDNELFGAFRRGVDRVGNFETDVYDSLNKFFAMAWDFVLSDEERCRCYVRYYYSIYFKGNSREAHKKLFSDIVEDIAPIFKEDADVEAILHSVFTSFLDFAIRVYNGDLENNEINRPHIFNVLRCMMMNYLKTSA